MNIRLPLAASLALLACTPMVGCSGDGGGGFGQLFGDPAKDAMALLPESVKQSAEGYLSGLGSVTNLLAGAHKYSDLLALIPELQPLLAQLGEASSALASLSPEVRGQVAEAFGDRLPDANSLFTSQLDRLKSGLGLPPVVSDMLGGVNLFG